MPLWAGGSPRKGDGGSGVPFLGLHCCWRSAPGARASVRGTLHHCSLAVGQHHPNGPFPCSTATRPIYFWTRGSDLGTRQVESRLFAKGRKEVSLFKPFWLLQKVADWQNQKPFSYDSQKCCSKDEGDVKVHHIVPSPYTTLGLGNI